MASKKYWWSKEYGFFGSFYIEGDNSLDGYLQSKKQSLEERTSTEVKGIINLLKLKVRDKILDIPCGYGRHSIELAKQGFNVVGVDINSVHLKQAKKNANNSNLDIIFEEKNMLNLKYQNEFDAVINMFYSFGFFEKDKE
ncbi:MAG: class I SAM-dependent methyltransferase, partial [archaeon]|nr:class I SAM-dependent methyltransferase [archaeon]